MSAFEPSFQAYLTNIRLAQQQNQHHDHRRALFLDLLRDGFGIKAADIEVEQLIKIDLRGRGWIDALFRNVIFEFKRDLEKEGEEGRRELRDYLSNLKYGSECIAMLTDGLLFEAYRLAPDAAVPTLQVLDTFDLNQHADDPAAVFLWLDAYLFSRTGIVPTSADMVQRYGAKSPTFLSAAAILGDLLRRKAQSPELRIKQQQWSAVLAKAYGTDVGSDDLFIRHTYLNQFAKLLAYTALGNVPRTDEELIHIVDGTAFHRWNVENVGEADFFAWILGPEVQQEALLMLRRLAHSLVVYDLTKINEDLFKQLYQNLVDPDTRHDLGEYYTPSWLAELILEEIDYSAGQSLLDPACGSGTFLFCALRRLAEKGMAGWELVDFALENVVGMDVHPLAVTTARINYLLAILPHMRGPRPSQKFGLVQIPVYLADALQTMERNGVHKDTLILPVDRERDEKFFIPESSARSEEDFNYVIDKMTELLIYSDQDLNFGLTDLFIQMIRERFAPVRAGIGEDMTPRYWLQNFRLLKKLIEEGRDSIWTYILRNTARPLVYSLSKFDVVVGNPPWVSYRFIKDKTYMQEIKGLTQDYGLLASEDVKLYTQMELATLFMAHCTERYLKPSGTLAMVMPRSVITGAKQHRPFQMRGFSRVLDLLGVFPLFNVPSCILIWRATTLHSNKIPTKAYSARFPAHEITLKAARAYLSMSEGQTRLLGEVTVASPHYYDQFKQGASLVPRNLCFVRPFQELGAGDAAANPTVQSDPDADEEAKAPWKGVRLQGKLHPKLLYATLLSKNLLPFGVRKLNLVALPMKVNAENRLEEAQPMDYFQWEASESIRTWFTPADQIWNELKKETSGFPHLMDQFDYQRKLTSQQVRDVYKVLYTSSGVHLAACVQDTYGDPPLVYGFPTQGFVHDSTTYCFSTINLLEAHYLCAVLNAPCVDDAIKEHQPRGKGVVGQRHVQRIPFEVCAIPLFDPANADHLELARLSQQAHDLVAQAIANGTISGQVVAARRGARAAAAEQIAAIDEIARRLLGL